MTALLPRPCDALGCEARDDGALGWVTVDLHCAELFELPLRFCSVRCTLSWLERERVTSWRAPLTPLDDVLRADEPPRCADRALHLV